MARNPSIELYRACLMLGIVTLHTCQCAKLGFSPLARWVEFCVDGFVFISGWYGIRFRWTKIARLYGLAFYCSMLYALGRWCFLDSAPWSTGAFLVEVVHRTFAYWFVNAYVVLMCFAPVVDAALQSHASRKAFVPLLTVVFVWSFACIVPGLKGWLPQPAGFGAHTFLTLLGVYVVARIACLDRWLERFSTRRLLAMLLILSLLAVCNLNKYNSPVAVLLGGTLFALFSRIPPSYLSSAGRAMLFLSPSLLSVYLLHGSGADYAFLRVAVSRFSNPWLAVAVTVPLVFFACILCDMARRALRFLFALPWIIPRGHSVSTSLTVTNNLTTCYE